MAQYAQRNRPVPRRTSSTFLSAFASNAGSSPSSSSPVLTNPPPTSFHPVYATSKEPAGMRGDDASVADGGSVYSGITHSTTLGGSSSGAGYSAATDRSYAGSIASGVGGGATGAWNSRASLLDMLNKRLGTWGTLKRAHQGTLYWSNTIHLPLPAIQASVEPAVLRSRPYAFSLLGMSLAPLLELHSLADVVLYANRTLDQFDSAAVHVAGGSSVNKSGTMKGIFKGGSKSGKRPSVGAGSGPGGDVAGAGASGDLSADFLMVYNQPFPPDYFQTLTTFFDILIELYNKLFALLSPQQATQLAFRSQLAGLPLPLHRALEWTYPSVSSPESTTPHTAITVTDPTSTSWRYPSSTPTPQQAAFSPGADGSSSSGHGHSNGGWETPTTLGFQSPPLSLSGTTVGGGSLRGSLSSGETVRQDVIDGITRLDSRIRKITNVVMKELETLARKEIKEEVAHLESLLSMLSPSDEDHFNPPSGLASASLWALGTREAERAIQRYVHV